MPSPKLNSGGRMSTKIPICLAILTISLLLFTCGTEPPAPLWTGSKEDTTAVENLVTANESYYVSSLFASTKDSIKLQYQLYIDTSRVPLMEKVFTVDSIAERYVPDLLGFKLDNSRRRQKLVFTRDTSCTVTIIDSFEASIEYHVAQLCSLFYFRDTLPDTSAYKPLLDSVRRLSVSFDFTKSFKRGEAKTYLFFDYDSATGWTFEKMTPTVISFPAPESVPSVNDVKIYLINSTRIDTVFYSTTNNKLKAMNLFRPLDSVLTFKTGDSVKIEVHTYYGANEAGFYVFYGHYGTTHKQLEDKWNSVPPDFYNGTWYLKFDSPGNKRIYLQMLDTRSFYIPNTQHAKKDFYSTIWIIPVKVVP